MGVECGLSGIEIWNRDGMGIEGGWNGGGMEWNVEMECGMGVE